MRGGSGVLMRSRTKTALPKLCRRRARDQRTYAKKARKLQSYRHKPLSRFFGVLPDHPCPTSVLA